MGFYRTCARCAFEKAPCERRAEVAARIKGTGLTSVTFRCALRTSLFHPGQRVAVTWEVYGEPSYYECPSSLESWPATVVQETAKGFVILVDDVESDEGTPARDYIRNEKLFCNVRVGKLKALEEPDRRVCGFCGNPEAADGTVPGCDGAEMGGDRCLAPHSRAPIAELADASEDFPF